ncbi:MAG: 50S ribosomal protein L21 [Holosporaceae bacterium]
MFAVLKTGGKQYRVAPGEVFVAEKIAGVSDKGDEKPSAGRTHVFKEILCVASKDKTHFGKPLLDKASVTAEVIDDVRSKKVLIFKKKRRNNYRRLNGHRQEGLLLRVKDISLDGKSLLGDLSAKPAAVKKPAAKTTKKAAGAAEAVKTDAAKKATSQPAKDA